MKTYRIDDATLEQIQAIKDFYSEKGFDLSDAAVIQKAISSYMDTVTIEKGEFKHHPSGGKSLSFIKRDDEGR